MYSRAHCGHSIVQLLQTVSPGYLCRPLVITAMRTPSLTHAPAPNQLMPDAYRSPLDSRPLSLRARSAAVSLGLDDMPPGL